MLNATPALLLAARLRDAVSALRFSGAVDTVYHPLEYAWPVHAEYLRRYARRRARVLILGMNPGPFGMVQTGIPFGEVAVVRDWLGLSGAITAPARQHAKRPVLGFACQRSEVSGRRLWGLLRARFGTAEACFAEHLVANWCPLAFVTASGANLTPDKLPGSEQAALAACCDAHLRDLLTALDVEVCVGVGKIAAAAAERCGARRVVDCPHPSPANPAANRDWAGLATRALVAGGVWT